MTHTVPPYLEQDSTPWRTLLNHAIVATSAGALSCSFAAYAYYDDVLRPLSHTFGIWVMLVALLSARQERMHAVLRSTVALLAAVLAFYLGKKFVYGLRYPGMPYELNSTTVATWLSLALVVGFVLGVAFSRIGSPDRGGAIALAGAIGLLLADSFGRASNYSDDASLVIFFAVIAISAVLAVSSRTRKQLVEAAAWTPLMAVIGYLLVAGPDVLEQLLYAGSAIGLAFTSASCQDSTRRGGACTSRPGAGAAGHRDAATLQPATNPAPVRNRPSWSSRRKASPAAV